MNKEHPNISILKQFNPTNPSSASGVLAEDFVWHYINPELPELEGEYFGFSGLMDFFKKIGMRTSGSFQVNPITTTPLGDQLVVTLVKDSMTLEGKSIKIEAVVIWCIVDGKIKEAWDIPIILTTKMIETIKERL
ncbi:nuclear transport factor 2 family protein [Flagellimonas sp.]|uniref:nuclear transport factor 2 family protein n=1 Tax=Flagellimonas sp. TaxID=2058762 RepID=UPI003F4A08F4